MTLRIGQIDYLNIWHVFQLLAKTCPEGPDFRYTTGHPSALNAALAAGDLDISPSSSFEYLRGAEDYCLLPNASISADQEVQSVLFLSPVPLAELPAWMEKHPGPVCQTSASATSTALLRILWTCKWALPEPVWRETQPGHGLATGRPALEIGNHALRLFTHPPQKWQVIDLATQWREWTGLPFVFAVWIVRRNLPKATRLLVHDLQKEIAAITSNLTTHFTTLSASPNRPDWLMAADLVRYWQAMTYTLGPREQAGLMLFASLCSEMGLLPGAPGLNWFEDKTIMEKATPTFCAPY